MKGPISHFQSLEPSTELMYFSLWNDWKDIRYPCAYRILKFYFKKSKEICSVSRFLKFGLRPLVQGISNLPLTLFYRDVPFQPASWSSRNQWTQDPIYHVLKIHLENNCSIQSSFPSFSRNCWKCNFAVGISFLVLK